MVAPTVDEGRLADVVLYSVLTFALAWALFLPLIPNPFDLLGAERTPSELVGLIWGPWHAPILIAGLNRRQCLRNSSTASTRR